MAPLDPPFLEFEFYVGPAGAEEQAVRAAEALVRTGARLTGDIDVAQGGGPVSRLSPVDLASMRTRAQGQLRRIYLDGATGITKKTELIEIRRGVILLRTEGEEFS